MKVTFVGNLTKDVTTGKVNEKNYARFTVAENVGFGDKKTTNFIEVTAWGVQATNCAKYLSKGKKVYICGSFNQRSFDKDGEKKTVWGCNPDTVEFLTPQETNTPHGATPLPDDDMPF